VERNRLSGRKALDLALRRFDQRAHMRGYFLWHRISRKSADAS
jgi:hypothetical protein